MMTVSLVLSRKSTLTLKMIKIYYVYFVFIFFVVIIVKYDANISDQQKKKKKARSRTVRDRGWSSAFKVGDFIEYRESDTCRFRKGIVLKICVCKVVVQPSCTSSNEHCESHIVKDVKDIRKVFSTRQNSGQIDRFGTYVYDFPKPSKEEVKIGGKRHRDGFKEWEEANIPVIEQLHQLPIPLMAPSIKFDNCIVVAIHNILAVFGIDFAANNACIQLRKKGRIEKKSNLMDHSVIVDLMRKFRDPAFVHNIFMSNAEIQRLGSTKYLTRPMTSVTGWEQIFKNFDGTDVVILVFGLMEQQSDIGHVIGIDFKIKVIYEGSNAKHPVNPGIAFALSLKSAKWFLRYPQKVYPFYPKVERVHNK